jgi:F-type H+-transporting ATPase subunit b
MRITSLFLILIASPAFAASGPFFSLANTNFIVLMAFIVFVGVLVYLKVPALLMGLLDKRAEGIQAELDEAKALREEAQTILAGYERKSREVEAQAQKIVERAKVEAEEAAEAAKAALEASIERRLKAAEDQIASAQTSAVREVRDRAVEVAVAAASEVLANSISDDEADAMIEASIAEVKDRLH